MVQLYVRYGKIRELYIRSNIIEGNSFLKCESIPTFFDILMLMCFKCTFHVKYLSILMPKKLVEFEKWTA